MLYVVTTLRPRSSWGLGARLYLRSLALASQRENLPFRLLWTAACATDQTSAGMVQSFGDVLDPSTFPPALQSLKPHFGPGPALQPATCMLFVGEVVDAVERISHPDDCPLKNVVLTSWPASTLPPHLAVRLSAYDLVLVPEGEGRIFAEADVPNVVEVPWPAPTPAERTAPVKKLLPPGVRRLLCAAGQWEGEDAVRAVADAFVAGFRPSDGVGLVLACDAVPGQWIKDAVIEHGRDRLPFITVIEPYGLWDDPSAVDRAILAAHAFVDVSRRIGPSYWAHRAGSLGCPVVPAFSAATEAYTGEALWPGASRSQAWRGLLPPTELVKALRGSVVAAVRPSTGPADPAAAGAAVAGLITRLVSGETPVHVASEPAPAFAVPRRRVSQPAWTDGIGVVVPFGGDDVSGLRRCLAAVKEALREQDRLVVSVRGESGPVVKLCEELGVCCVASASGEGRWNMSAVRNAGVRWFVGSGPAQGLRVCAVDADVRVPPDYLGSLAREAYKRPGMVLTPYVIDEGAGIDTVRIASGMSMFPLDALIEARGFDEAYVGWGHEDIDLLHRLREMHGVAAVALPSLPTAVHTPHAARGGVDQKSRDHDANLARYTAAAKLLDAGEKVEVNERPWGVFSILHAPAKATPT